MRIPERLPSAISDSQRSPLGRADELASTASDGLPAVLFVKDLQQLLGLTASAIRKAMDAGRLGRYGVLGGRKFVLRDAFFAYLKSREIDPNRQAMRGPNAPAAARDPNRGVSA